MKPDFPFSASDFQTGTALMTCAEVGCYIRLLCHAWELDGLPNDPDKLAMLTQCDRMTVKGIIGEKFAPDGTGRLRNGRLEDCRAKAQDMSTKATKAAKHRWALPQSDEAKRIATVFRRSLTTEWSKKEIEAFKSIGKIDPDELAQIERFYAANRANEKAFLRTGLQAFCNNYRGELDKARQWAHRNPRSAGTASNGTEPPGFRAWMQEQFPSAGDKLTAAWADIPEHIKAEFRRNDTSRPTRRTGEMTT